MTKRRRVWGWTHKWLGLLGRGKSDRWDVTLDLHTPVVVINGYNTESDVCAARVFITGETDDGLPLYRAVTWDVLADLHGVADMPQVVDGFSLYFSTSRRGYLDLHAVSPVEHVSSLPATVAKLSFLALAALAEYNCGFQTTLEPGKLYLTVLKLRNDVVDDEKIIKLRNGFRHEPRPVSQKMLESADALLRAMRDSYTFPCKRWWE